MIPLLSLGNGKTLHLDGNEITQEEALDAAQKLLVTWGQIDHHVKAIVVYKIDNDQFCECPHAATLKEALEALETYGRRPLEPMAGVKTGEEPHGN